ncbi:histidine kinase [Paenibacillus chitinolyticus]|uniref:histidine kinase n=1 Tax=Paenibacillus chitinolyticus TaxID=79263 RepID=UPI002DC00541|nr:histidine kinase [Paenibacillus chitinolyticus]MEC0247040.1 histidine kinase [Paenibacillus chitinolyticus]
MDNFRRKTPEEILLSISEIHRGRLKIYIGAVSGSGKTYHMLREGQTLREQGIDVVLCAVSMEGRPETMEQAGGLERIESIEWMKDGVRQQDLPLDDLAARNPEVVLTDGLAHRNRPGALYPTRLEDIKFLLSKGISVLATVNVYELEGVRELARKMTGIVVEHTVPADTLELADEVRLIDATPETILNRLEEGGMRGCQWHERKVLERGNIGVLRELALRLVAEGVNESLEKHRGEMGMTGPSGADERILVSAQYHWNGSIYVRRGQQIADRLSGDLFVVSFTAPGKALSKDAATFRRSIIKLVEKVGGTFDELPFPGRRKLAQALIRYGIDRKVTRIVLGHSKHSRWQEFWQGSVLNDAVSRLQGIDLFVVADRAERDGERILPVKRKSDARQPVELYRRPSPQEMERQIRKARRGRFKVYIGAAPGVGKTYSMLREGNDLLRKNIDVVIGLLELHGRKETADQVGDLELIPRKIITYRGTELQEMDTEAVIRRMPDLVLVDELAHTNVPQSVNKKRYEDILEILNAGISVISTVNVQHLESLNDSVEQLTGVRVRETVPDSILRLADEVELIDVTPQTLRQRMKEGKIYGMDKVDQALGHFFKTVNLIALRELALREIADDVDERLEAWERVGSLRGPWRREEVIFVCVKLNQHAERIIRRGFRIAYRLKARWHVAYIRSGPAAGDEEARIAALQTLTERLGGRFEVLGAAGRRRTADGLLARALELSATQLIIGQARESLWERLFHGSIVKRVMRGARSMDVLVVAESESAKARRGRQARG